MARSTAAAPRWATRGTVPNSFSISRQTFRDLEEWLRDNEQSIKDFQVGMDTLIRLMALTVKGSAQQKTMGPYDPLRHNHALSQKIPVRRISGLYFAGWRVRRLGLGIWMVYNDDRAAFFVEIGARGRPRRPILKLSVLVMLKMIQSTRTAERMVDSIMAPRRNAKGQFQSFRARMAGSSLLGVVGPTGNLP